MNQMDACMIVYIFIKACIVTNCQLCEAHSVDYETGCLFVGQLLGWFSTKFFHLFFVFEVSGVFS